VRATLRAMARIIKSQFGNRHHQPAPRSTPGDPPLGRRRFDWPLLALVALVFVVSFVWLF